MAFNIAVYLTLDKTDKSTDQMTNSITPEERRFMDDLAARESGGNYKKVNKFGYIGRYQFGESALEELGYYKKTVRRWGPKNHWEGTWLGKYGINSKKDFLNNPHIQDIAAKELFIRNWQYIQSAGFHQFIDKNIQGIKITKSGLIAGVHLLGIGGLSNFLKGNKSQDGFGTDIAEYITKFEGYKLSLVIPVNTEAT